MSIAPSGGSSGRVPGFADAGIDVHDGAQFSAEFEAFADALGFASAQALMNYILGEQWDSLDHKGNRWLCIKDLPNTPGKPAYIYVGIDDSRPG